MASGAPRAGEPGTVFSGSARENLGFDSVVDMGNCCFDHYLIYHLFPCALPVRMSLSSSTPRLTTTSKRES